MPKFTGETGKTLKVRLKSSLLGVRWAADHVSQSGTISLEVETHFVADGSAVKVTVKDAEGRAVESLDGKVQSGFYRTRYAVTKPNKTGGMYFEAELPDHGLKGVSGKVAVLPPTRITEPRWLTPEGEAAEELHPGQRYLLQAKVDAIPDRNEAVLRVKFQGDADADPAEFRTLDAKVKDGKVEVLWEIPADFRRPRPPSSDEAAARGGGSGNYAGNPAFLFEASYVGHTAVSPAVTFLPSVYMTVLEVEDALFNHDSAVFLPSAPMGPGRSDGGAGASGPSRATSGLGILASLFRHVDLHPDKKLVIAGHTDASGGAAYNFALSGERAEAVLAVLENDRDKWSALCHGRQKVEDYQQLLSHCHDLLGWDCDPGGVDGRLGDKTRQALQGFRARYNAGKGDLGFGSSPDLPEAALAGDRLKQEYWGAFFDLYQRELAQGLGVDAAGLDGLRGKVKFVDDGRKFLACGESFPIERPERGGFRSQSNRRIELLLFDPGEEPSLACPAARSTVHTPAECPVYGLRRYLRNFIAPLWLLRFRVVDEDDEPVEVQRPLRFEVKDREGRTAQSGTFTGGSQVLFFGDPLGRYTLFIEEREVCHLVDSGASTGPGGEVPEDETPAGSARLLPATLSTHGNILAAIDPPEGVSLARDDRFATGGTTIDHFWVGPDRRIFFSPPAESGLGPDFQPGGAGEPHPLEATPDFVSDPENSIRSFSDQLDLLGEAMRTRIREGAAQGEDGRRLRFMAEMAYSKALLAMERAMDNLEASGSGPGAEPAGDPVRALDQLASNVTTQWKAILDDLSALG
jgi:hypothetical protein